MKEWIQGPAGRILMICITLMTGIITSAGGWWALEVGKKQDATAQAIGTLQNTLVDRIHQNELKADHAFTREEWSTERLRLDAQIRDTERTITDMRITNAQTAVALNAIEKKLDQLLRDRSERGGEQ